DSIARAGNPRLTFEAPKKITTLLSIENFPPDSSQSAAYLEERDSSFRMHLAEGSFFALLIFGGLALIYRALARSEESRHMQENFLMAVTHELRTPLASLKLSFQGLLRGKFDAERAQKSNEMIETDIDRLDSLISDLLDAGKDVHERKMKPQTLDVRTYVSEYFAERENEFARGGVTLALFANTSGSQSYQPTVRMGSADLKRALDIVVDNAMKFGSDEVQLNVDLASVSSFVELSVSDNGIGLSPEEFPRIFERFYRVGSELTRSRPGVGLGLYLARQILHAYGGKIRVTSEGLNCGATFILSLPLAEKR
ncbi:HAMP domain-containing histidine kinase, partial [Gemmatimonas aurantiaca]|nr:HAMP domain-containing histidine kinase [Gemmatimonas aurantiaca]